MMGDRKGDASLTTTPAETFSKHSSFSWTPLPLLEFLIWNFFCSLYHAFSKYDERKTNEMHFQSKPYI
jgi:hypothetical protein